MPRLRSTLALAAVTAAATTPAFASAPKGNGLIEHTGDSCVIGTQTFESPAMLLTAGSTFWFNDVHYAVVHVTWTGEGWTASHDYGTKAGLPGPQMTCHGTAHDSTLGDYTIDSVDVPIR